MLRVAARGELWGAGPVVAFGGNLRELRRAWRQAIFFAEFAAL